MPKTEIEKLAEIDDLFDFIVKVQDRFSSEVASPEEA